MVCDGTVTKQNRKGGWNSGPVLRRLWTKVHEMLRQRRRPFVLPNALACPGLWPSYWRLLIQYIFWTKAHIHCVSKQVPTLKLSVALSNLNRFSKLCTTGNRMKFATKSIQHHPPHLRHVATLPCEIKNSNFLHIFSDNTRYGRKCQQIVF